MIECKAKYKFIMSSENRAQQRMQTWRLASIMLPFCQPLTYMHCRSPKKWHALMYFVLSLIFRCTVDVAPFKWWIFCFSRRFHVKKEPKSKSVWVQKNTPHHFTFSLLNHKLNYLTWPEVNTSTCTMNKAQYLFLVSYFHHVVATMGSWFSSKVNFDSKFPFSFSHNLGI